MRNITIELADGTFEGNVHITSESKFSAWRVPKSSFDDHKELIKNNGIYIFLMDQNKIYIGESGDIFERNQGDSGHRDDLDTRWHTLIAFPCSENLQDNQLRFIENALCEHFYPFSFNGERCLTNKKPAESSCNENYRRKKSRLSPVQINMCNQHVADILHYISLLRDPHFTSCASAPRLCVPSAEASQPALQTVQTAECDIATDDATDFQPRMMLFSYSSQHSPIHAVAEIEVFPANKEKRKIVLKKGSQLSDSISPFPAFYNSDRVKQDRQKYEETGHIQNHVIEQDIVLSDSPSFALGFVTGTSRSGNKFWKTVVEPHLSLEEVEDLTTN